MLTLKGTSETSALSHTAEEAACPVLVDREQLESLGNGLLAEVMGCW